MFVVSLLEVFSRMTGYYRRLFEIMVRFLPFAFAFLRDRRRFILFGRSRRVSPAVHEKRAAKLSKLMLELGPTFIKVGQVLSTRPDIIPPTYATEFARLQDQVPEDNIGEPSEILPAEVGDVIDVDSVAPLAGGSLAYVYTAELTSDYQDTYESWANTTVALKVRRPGLRGQIKRDLRIIRRFIPVITPFVEERYQYSLENLADDFERVILNEIDFRREARMMTQIDDNFSDTPSIRIPQVDIERSSERLVFMEYVPATKITDPSIVDRAISTGDIAEQIAHTYLKMGLVHGTFHADPHPGNLALDVDDRLVLYDFGMSEQLTPETQALIVDMYRSLARRDVEGLIDTLVALDVFEPSVDRREIRRLLGLAIDNLEGRSEITWRAIVLELFENLHDVPFRIPPNVMLLIRVGTVAEGVCRQLDPDFDFVETVRSFLLTEGLYREEFRAIMSEMEHELIEAIPALIRLPAQIERVAQMVERGKVSIQTPSSPNHKESATGYAILAGSFVIATAILLFHEQPYAIVAGGLMIVSLILFLFRS